MEGMIATWVFMATGLGAFGMLGIRMLEIRYERSLLLAGFTMKTERKIKPYVKALSAKIGERKRVVREFIERIPTVASERAANARDSWERHTDTMASSIRGKRMLSRGSVSFFLLNISDHKLWGERAKELQAVSIKVEGEPKTDEEL